MFLLISLSIQVKSVSINREMNLLLTGTSKSILSVFDVRQPQKSIEVRIDSIFSNVAIFLDFNAMLRHLDREESEKNLD